MGRPPSVTPERAAAEADAPLAALTALLTGAGAGTEAETETEAERRATAVLLARAAAPPSPPDSTGAPGSGPCAPDRRPPG